MRTHSGSTQSYSLSKHTCDAILEVFKTYAHPFCVFLGHALLYELFLKGFPCLVNSSAQSKVHPEKTKGHSSQVRRGLYYCCDHRSRTHCNYSFRPIRRGSLFFFLFLVRTSLEFLVDPLMDFFAYFVFFVVTPSASSSAPEHVAKAGKGSHVLFCHFHGYRFR